MDAVARLAGLPPPEPDASWASRAPDSARSTAPYRIYNVGSNRPIDLSRCIEVLEQALGRKAQRKLMPMQLGDVPSTWADASDLIRDSGAPLDTPLELGLKELADWFLTYRRPSK